MERPKLKIALEPVDKATELLGLIGLILLIVLPIYFFNELPERIPRHYGVSGEPDGFSEKGLIWTLPVIGVILYLGMFWLNKSPHIFNYPQPVTKENARKLYTIGTRMIRILNAITTVVFAYITYSTIQTALGSQNGLGNWFLPVFILLIFGIMGYFTYKSLAANNG